LLSYYGIEKGIIKVAKGKTPQIRSGQRGPTGLRQIPIKFLEDESAVQSVVRLVKQMMAAQEHRSSASGEKDLASCQREIKTLTRKIDKMVYGIYGISREKQKIVESG
jgi:hypothetical protein